MKDGNSNIHHQCSNLLQKKRKLYTVQDETTEFNHSKRLVLNEEEETFLLNISNSSEFKRVHNGKSETVWNNVTAAFNAKFPKISQATSQQIKNIYFNRKYRNSQSMLSTSSSSQINSSSSVQLEEIISHDDLTDTVTDHDAIVTDDTVFNEYVSSNNNCPFSLQELKDFELPIPQKIGSTADEDAILKEITMGDLKHKIKGLGGSIVDILVRFGKG